MTLAIHLRASREQLPIDAPCDVDLTAVLRNDGTRPLAIYPGAAKLGPVVSSAGIDIMWSFELADAEGHLWPLVELRTYTGPPGNPPPPSWAASQTVMLAPGEEHAKAFPACWLPNAALEPRHLAVTALDPQGMDRVADLARRIDLAKSSVFLFGRIAQLDRAKDDFLRGRVVGFLAEPRSYEVRVGYVQEPRAKELVRVRTDIAALRFEVG